MTNQGLPGLAPCPFCGGEAENDSQRYYRNATTGRPETAAAVYCTKCNADMTWCYRDTPEVEPEHAMSLLVERWNTRHLASQPSSYEAGLDASRGEVEAHKVMTPEEYAAFNIQGWHLVHKDYDGFGAVAVSYRAPGPSEATPSTAGSVREALEWVRSEVFALCEATESACHNPPSEIANFSRGRAFEAKGIRNAMGEVIRERLSALTALSAPVEAPAAVKADCDASAAERVLSELMDRRLLNDVDDDLHQEIADALIRAARGDVSVKRIKWRGPIDAFPATIWEAKTAFGHFVIEEVSASDSPAYEVRFAGNLVAVKDDVEFAKAAAQSDFAQRIRSALAPGVVGDVVGAGEREARHLKTWKDLQALWLALDGGPRPRCRDCADFDGRCQGNGLPCDPQERALEQIKQLRASPSAAVREAHIDALSGLRDACGDLRNAVGPAKTTDGHLLGMIDTITNVEMPIDKIARWTGFIQGVLAARGVISVDEERERTRPIFTAALSGPGESSTSSDVDTTLPGPDDMDARFAWLESKAADMGYTLVREPEHPDSPHVAADRDGGSCTGKCDWTGSVEITQPTTGIVERHPMCRTCGSIVVGAVK